MLEILKNDSPQAQLALAEAVEHWSEPVVEPLRIEFVETGGTSRTDMFANKLKEHLRLKYGLSGGDARAVVHDAAWQIPDVEKRVRETYRKVLGEIDEETNA